MKNQKNTIADLHHERMREARETVRALAREMLVKIDDINFLNASEEQIDFLQAAACYLQDLAFHATSKLESIRRHNKEFTHSAAGSMGVVDCCFKATARTITKMTRRG